MYPPRPRDASPRVVEDAQEPKALELSPAEWRALGAQAQAHQLLEYAQGQLHHARAGSAARAWLRSQAHDRLEHTMLANDRMVDYLGEQAWVMG